MKLAALAGGVGGAKLADGLNRSRAVDDLVVVVNTGDDFSHFGLRISPDLDTVCYLLAGLANSSTGWGREEERWDTLSEIQRLGGPDWFKLGNKDLAVHLERTRRMDGGESLSQVTADFCQAWGVKARVVPMSDQPVPTLIESDQGMLPFQEYFVRLSCEPKVRGFIFQGAEAARPAPAVLPALEQADLVVICPSNPWVSIDPILAIPGIRASLAEKIVLGVSPLIGGKALKGPAAKMYREMGLEPSAAAVAKHYGGLLDGFVIDDQDQGLEDEILSSSQHRLSVFTTDIWMKDQAERQRVAEKILSFGRTLVEEA